MSTKGICNRIQDLVGASTRITLAPYTSQWPPAINEADLPVALTRPGAGSWPHEALADVWCRRTFVIDVYVMPNALGQYHEGIEQTLALIDDLGGRLTTDFTLEGSTGGSAMAIDSEPRDRGLVILTYAGVEYRGTVFELDVVEDV